MRQNILLLTKRLIAIPSTKHNVSAQKKVLAVARAELHDFAFTEYKHNGIQSIIFYNTKKKPKKFKILLNAHLDVVPGTEKQYHPYIKDDRLYGRGAYDMKAAAAVEILLFKAIANKVHYPLGLQLVIDEEIGGFDGAKYQKQQGVSAECILVGETSSNFSVGIRSKGIIWITITFKGIAAHAAYLWNGKNALLDVNTFLTKLWRKYPIPKAEVWRTTINVSSIQTTNTANNKVPDTVTVQLDVRYIPNNDASVIRTIQSLLPKTAKLEIPIHEPARESNDKHAHVQKLTRIAGKMLQKTIPIVGKCGGTDLRHYPDSTGIEFGPIGCGPHEDNEWVSIKSLINLYDILYAWLLDASLKKIAKNVQ